MEKEIPTKGNLQQNLHQRLDKLENERDQITEAIQEVQRRIGILDVAMSLTPIGKEYEEKISQESVLTKIKAESTLISP